MCLVYGEANIVGGMFTEKDRYCITDIVAET